MTTVLVPRLVTVKGDVRGSVLVNLMEVQTTERREEL